MSRSETRIMDGGMGTFLFLHGIPRDSCLESLNLTRPSLILEIHRSYLDAGAEAVVAHTFGANRPRLSQHRQVKNLERINRAGVRIARMAARRRQVYASVGPLGRQARKMTLGEMIRHFREQIRSLEKERPSAYLIETMTSLGEAEAATIAVREISDRPITVLMSLPAEPNRTVVETLEIISSTLRSAGATVLGANCGKGLEDSYTFLKALSLVDPGPFCARPAAGLAGRIVSPEEFSLWGPKFEKLGCRWIGGCCGTTPAHIRALAGKIRLS